ncbi:hypothetical protein [Salipiger sp.]|uniref:hypothetical protein n=1 Tax=Salipiger sp. TaxID=2078585 RepID=UPI003A977FE4
MGIRLDGGTAYAGGVITRFYDPAGQGHGQGPTPEKAIKRMDRALREFRIRVSPPTSTSSSTC